MLIPRRQFCRLMVAGVSAAFAVPRRLSADEPFQLNYLLATALYGRLPLAEILPEAAKLGAGSIDVWREIHANQREQIAEMGLEAFAALLKRHNVTMNCTTIWSKPFAEECRFVKRMGGQLLVTGFIPESEPQKFIEQLKPQLAVAEETGVTVCMENHGGSFDAIRAFADAAAEIPQLKIAFSPYHLPQDAEALAKTLVDVGPKIGLFYAWQHGVGAMKPVPKEQELLQLPGRGDLDFTPLLAALKQIRYAGPTEIFMHPFPRGLPIHPTAAEVTAEINRARDYLTRCLRAI